MKRKLLFLLLPLIPIVLGIIFAIYYSIPRLEYIYNFCKMFDVSIELMLN